MQGLEQKSVLASPDGCQEAAASRFMLQCVMRAQLGQRLWPACARPWLEGSQTKAKAQNALVASFEPVTSRFLPVLDLPVQHITHKPLWSHQIACKHVQGKAWEA